MTLPFLQLIRGANGFAVEDFETRKREPSGH